MDVVELFEALLVVGVAVAVAAVAAATLARPSRLPLLAAAGLVGALAGAAWVALAVEADERLALVAGGLTAAFAATLATLPLRRALARVRRIDEELARSEERIRAVAEAEARLRATELEHLLARSRADSLSLLAEEERRIAEERRAGLAERERTAGDALAAALTEAQQRAERRLSAWAEDFERAQQGLGDQVAKLDERQQELIAGAEERLTRELDRLQGQTDEQREALTRLRADLAAAAGQVVAQTQAELESHAADRRRALHELGERLRTRERELLERIEREEGEVAQRIQLGLADIERRALEQLERSAERSWTRYSDEAAGQFQEAIRAAREDAAKRLGRELDRAVEQFSREAGTVLAERLSHVGDSGAQRLEKRMSQIAAGLERQRGELLAAVEHRLSETESELRRRMQGIGADADAERAVLEARLHELAREVDEAVAHSRERLAELDARRP